MLGINSEKQKMYLKSMKCRLKEFLRIRDNSPVFNEAKKVGAAGIPCFVLEDGSVTLIPEEAGLTSRPITEGMSCNIDGSGC